VQAIAPQRDKQQEKIPDKFRKQRQSVDPAYVDEPWAGSDKKNNKNTYLFVHKIVKVHILKHGWPFKNRKS
jgi:hypothetical protein